MGVVDWPHCPQRSTLNRRIASAVTRVQVHGLVTHRSCAVQPTRAAAWAVLHGCMEAEDEQSQECAVHLLADVLWQGRADEVQVAVKDLFITPSALPGKNSLWQVSLLPGPNAASHLPKDHPLQAFFKVRAAHNLLTTSQPRASMHVGVVPHCRQ